MNEWLPFELAFEYVRLIHAAGEGQGEGFSATCARPATQKLIDVGHAAIVGDTLTITLDGVLWWGLYVNSRLRKLSSYHAQSSGHGNVQRPIPIYNVLSALRTLLPERNVRSSLSTVRQYQIVQDIAAEHGFRFDPDLHK